MEGRFGRESIRRVSDFTLLLRRPLERGQRSPVSSPSKPRDPGFGTQGSEAKMRFPSETQ